MPAHWKDTTRLNGEARPADKPYRLVRLNNENQQLEFYWSAKPGELAAYLGENYQSVWGQLDCKSGKAMNPENRIFIADAQMASELQQAGVCRPCGNCNKLEYLQWKTVQSLQERG